jgi:hypothetical protein
MTQVSNNPLERLPSIDDLTINKYNTSSEPGSITIACFSGIQLDTLNMRITASNSPEPYAVTRWITKLGGVEIAPELLKFGESRMVDRYSIYTPDESYDSPAPKAVKEYMSRNPSFARVWTRTDSLLWRTPRPWEVEETGNHNIMVLFHSSFEAIVELTQLVEETIIPEGKPIVAARIASFAKAYEAYAHLTLPT